MSNDPNRSSNYYQRQYGNEDPRFETIDFHTQLPWLPAESPNSGARFGEYIRTGKSMSPAKELGLCHGRISLLTPLILLSFTVPRHAPSPAGIRHLRSSKGWRRVQFGA